MTLDRFIIKNKLTSRQFAKMGGWTIFAVRKWRQRKRMPRPETIIKIASITNGKVKPTDWY